MLQVPTRRRNGPVQSECHGDWNWEVLPELAKCKLPYLLEVREQGGKNPQYAPLANMEALMVAIGKAHPEFMWRAFDVETSTMIGWCTLLLKVDRRNLAVA